MVVEEIEASEFVSGDSSNIIHNSNGLEVETIGYLDQSLSGDSSGEFSGRKSRQNNMRRLWDALCQRRSSLEFVANDGFGRLVSDDSRRSFNRNLGQSGDSLEEGRNSLMVWAFQRHREVLVQGICPSGCHYDGHCNCETSVVEETNTRTLLSRIAKLVQVLNKVLDEVLDESFSFSRLASFSLGPLPAPDTLVNSFPVHIHKKPLREDQDDGQCYICFSDYIDGDEIRTLPCSHQYHMDCVDKWLKEVHRVCPLCRNNVGESYLDVLY